MCRSLAPEAEGPPAAASPGRRSLRWSRVFHTLSLSRERRWPLFHTHTHTHTHTETLLFERERERETQTISKVRVPFVKSGAVRKTVGGERADVVEGLHGRGAHPRQAEEAGRTSDGAEREEV